MVGVLGHKPEVAPWEASAQMELGRSETGQETERPGLMSSSMLRLHVRVQMITHLYFLVA